MCTAGAHLTRFRMEGTQPLYIRSYPPRTVSLEPLLDEPFPNQEEEGGEQNGMTLRLAGDMFARALGNRTLDARKMRILDSIWKEELHPHVLGATARGGRGTESEEEEKEEEDGGGMLPESTKCSPELLKELQQIMAKMEDEDEDDEPITQDLGEEEDEEEEEEESSEEQEEMPKTGKIDVRMSDEWVKGMRETSELFETHVYGAVKRAEEDVLRSLLKAEEEREEKKPKKRKCGRRKELRQYWHVLFTMPGSEAQDAHMDHGDAERGTYFTVIMDLTEGEEEGKTCFLLDEKGNAYVEEEEEGGEGEEGYGEAMTRKEPLEVTFHKKSVTAFEGGVLHYGQTNRGSGMRVSIMVTLSSEEEDRNDENLYSLLFV